MTTSNLFGLSGLSADSELTARDIERALRSMKRDLALVDLKRKLLAPDIDGSDALGLSVEILALQNAA